MGSSRDVERVWPLGMIRWDVLWADRLVLIRWNRISLDCGLTAGCRLLGVDDGAMRSVRDVVG